LSEEDNNQRPLSQKDKRQYELMHQRFVHCGPEKLRHLYKVSNIKKIRIPNYAKRSLYETCKIAKLRKRIQKEQSP